jgi:hypothetical protein
MLDEAVLKMFEGRSKKVKCLFKKQALSITTWLSENEGEWEEAQIYSFMSNSWGRNGLDKGNITNFCRCFKDANGKSVFNVEGRRPRKIQFLTPNER